MVWRVKLPGRAPRWKRWNASYAYATGIIRWVGEEKGGALQSAYVVRMIIS